ncbi:MAG: cyclase family protein [Chloroflexota bacterium]|nr:cyclase family protein [Dehalococcoidia bacterium]MDW8253917.1 cyclase family protein [Chloroflexota bacterium]
MTGASWQTLLQSSRVFDLSHPLEPTIPVSPNHPGFRMALLRRHGDSVRADGVTAANEMMVLGGHTGTHIDALAHVGFRGMLHGGVDAAEAQTGGRFKQLGVETIAPMLCRGLLLDVAGARGVATLPPAEKITAEELRAVARRQGIGEPQPGDVVLIRSGWARHWSEPETYLGHESGVPGPDVSAAEWLAERRVRATGHDSMAYEWLAPGAGHSLLPAHKVLLVDAGIYILENVNLEALAAAGVYEFLFICIPLRLVGATGCPVRPLAVAA